MAVQSRVNWLGGQRVDLPDLLATDSYNVNDMRSLIAALTGTSSYVIKGLEVTGWTGLTINVSIADCLILCPSNSVAPFYKGLTSDGVLTTTLRSESTIYLELVLETTTSGAVSKGFWDSLAVTADSPAGSEFSETVDSQILVVPKLVQNFSGFTPNGIKIAKINTGTTEIQDVIDSRELFFRLATGGSVPSSTYSFPWDSAIRQEPIAVSDDPNALSKTNSLSIYYSETNDGTVINDKGIGSFKDWLNAAMSSIKELKGTSTWYQDAGTSSGYPTNLSILSLFLDSQAGHSILAIPESSLFWGKTTAGTPDDILRSEGTSTVQWQTNYGYPVLWELGGTFASSSSRAYTNINFTSPSISSGSSLYLALQRNVRLTDSLVKWRPSSGAPTAPSVPVSWTASKTVIADVNNLFTNVAVGDYVKKESDGILSYYKVTKLYNGSEISTLGAIADSTVTAIELDRTISGIDDTQEQYRYFRTRYSNSDLQVVASSSMTPANDVDWYWIGRRTGNAFYLRDYGDLAQGQEVEISVVGGQDQSENDFGAEPILALEPDVAYVSNTLAFNPTLLSPSTNTYLTLYKRKTRDRINSNSPNNPSILSYRIESQITLNSGTGQELWIKISDDYSATTSVLSSGDVTNVLTTNVYEVRAANSSPLRNYDNRQVFMLAKEVTIGGNSYVMFFDGAVVGTKGRATPQRLQVENVWIHDTDVDVTTTATDARLFENASQVKIGKSLSRTRIEGAQSSKRETVSGSYSVLLTDHILSVDTTSSAATITLPAISAVGDGHTVIIKDRANNSYTNTITVARTGSDKIDNTSSSYVIQSNGASYVFVANSALNDWEII
jgi:hypothetical protein